MLRILTAFLPKVVELTTPTVSTFLENDRKPRATGLRTLRGGGPTSGMTGYRSANDINKVWFNFVSPHSSVCWLHSQTASPLWFQNGHKCSWSYSSRLSSIAEKLLSLSNVTRGAKEKTNWICLGNMSNLNQSLWPGECTSIIVSEKGYGFQH